MDIAIDIMLQVMMQLWGHRRLGMRQLGGEEGEARGGGDA